MRYLLGILDLTRVIMAEFQREEERGEAINACVKNGLIYIANMSECSYEQFKYAASELFGISLGALESFEGTHDKEMYH